MSDRDNIFLGNNYTIMMLDYDANTNQLLWEISCGFALGDWIETQDAAEWSLIGQRHLAKYRVTDTILSKIQMMTILTENT